nr:NepR family anti-sigma factor [uncultured Sphingomonas sp.]
MSGSKQDKGKQTPESSGNPPKRKGKGRAGAVGHALKTVYDDMVREDVPQDFLDLLGKLD